MASVNHLVVNGYEWRAIAWQSENGVPPLDYGENPLHQVPADMHHAAPGQHQKLNELLVEYINQHLILI